MNRLRSILVGVDFSECANAAVQQAARMAHWNGATLHVLHVIDSLAVTELAEAMKVPVEEQRQTALKGARHELTRWLGNPDSLGKLKTDIVIGIPLDEILKRTRESNADLIVLGAQGESTISPQAAMMPLRVLRQSPVKVLLVDSHNTTPFQAIVVCVDFSPSACEVIAQAKRLATLDASRVDFLHVYDPPWNRLRYLMPALSISSDLQEQYLNTLRCQLEGFVGTLSGLEARLVLHESPRHQSGIAAYAQLQDADLIVLATNGRRNPGDDLLGSTAERLIKELPCSVLVVKPPPPANVAEC